MDAGNKQGGIVTVWQMPHPPVVVPEVGHGREAEIEETLASMRAAAGSIAQCNADTLIVISPHATMSPERIIINADSPLRGDLGQFGARAAALEFAGDSGLAGQIAEEASAAGIAVTVDAGLRNQGGGRYFAPQNKKLDHGSVVPLYFVDKAIKTHNAVRPKLIIISIAYMDNSTLYRFGGRIAQAVNKSGGTAALITSGDLSHKLTVDGPYGFDPAGPEFDRHILDCIAARDAQKLIDTDETLLERAAQCGFYGLLMAYGALDEIDGARAAVAGILSYEGTFGVGYAIARLL